MSNATAFVRDFNLMPSLVQSLDVKYKGVFLHKLDLIHQCMIRITEKEARAKHG